jgi:serine/threonine protein kinase
MSQATQGSGPESRSSQTWRERVPADLQPLERSHDAYLGSLDDGTQVVVKPVTVGSAEEAARMLEYLKRLAGYANTFLLPVRGAELRGDVLWVISEFDGGRSLRELAARGAFSPSQVVAIGMGVLSGLDSLQRMGLSHGNLHSGNVHVSLDGRVRLSDYALRPRFRPGSSRLGWPDPKADLVAAGLLLCGALEIPPNANAVELSQAERSVPALVAAVRVMAEGGAGRYAGAALGLFEEASGTRARPLQLERSRQELAALVSSGERPPVTSPTVSPPALEPQPARSMPGPQAPARPNRSLLWLPLGGGTLVLALLLLAWVFGGPGSARAARTPVSSTVSASPHAGSAAPPSPAATAASSGSSDAAAVPPAAVTPEQGAPAGAPADAQPAATDGQPAAPGGSTAPAPPPPLAAARNGDPTGAVSQFYNLVSAHAFGDAVQLWTPSMQAAYPPADNIDNRFSNTSSMDLRRNQLVSVNGGSAVVAIDLVEVRGGRTYHWVGNWYVVQSPSGWLLDRPGLHPA